MTIKDNNEKINKSCFERHPGKTLFIFLLIVFTSIIFIAEKYLAHKNSSLSNLKAENSNVILREYQPNSSFVYMPDSKHLKETDSLINKEYVLRIDENGFIKPSKIHDDADISLVFLGGSTTAGRFVEEKYRFPYLVGRIIEKETHKKVNSYNSGVEAHRTVHSTTILLNKIIPLNPTFVIMKHNINDLIVLCYTSSYWNDHPRRRLIAETEDNALYLLLRRMRDKLIPNLYSHIERNIVVNYFKRNILNVKDKKDGGVVIRGLNVIIDRERIAHAFRRNLQTFIEICKTQNTAPVLMTQANRLKDHPDHIILAWFQEGQGLAGFDYHDFKDLLDSFNEIIRDVAKKSDIPLIDLATKIPQEKEYMYDMVHLNDKGSQYAADIISTELLKLLK